MFNSKILKKTVIIASVASLTSGCVWATENTTDIVDALTMEFVRIPAGSFQMGSPSTEKDRNNNEGPIHEKKITKPFYIGKYEVTQAQWKTVMETTVDEQRNKFNIPWRLKGTGPEYPMYYVSWEEAVEFCKRLGSDYRLPTEAEWEYACRAGSKTRFFYGDDPDYSQLDQYAWYYGNSDNRTHPVGQKKPNSWGLYDMYGNVSEWCSDRYPLLGGYEVAESINRTKSETKYMGNVVRGGNWLEKSDQCRSASRRPDRVSDLTGFRVVFAGDIDNAKEVFEIALPKGAAKLITGQEQQAKDKTDSDLIITGVVRDEKGMPINDVEIEIQSSEIWSVRNYAQGQFEAYKWLRSKNSEEDYLFARQIEKNLATVIKIDKEANVLDVKLEPGVTLTGKVVDSNNIALEGAIVTTALHGPDWRTLITPVGMKADAEGKFTFKALPIWYKYSLYARLLHYLPNKLEFNSSDARDNRMDLGQIVLARGKFSISGIVVDANDKPVANAWVYCTGKEQAGINSRTDANGRFKADGIFEGQVQIMASVQRGRDYFGASIETEAGATDVKIVLSKGSGPPIKGRACFPAETDVWINGKVIKISEIIPGQTVGKFGCAADTFGQIEKIEEHKGSFECRDITLENGNRISVVEAHCFMLDSGCWIAAQDLRKGHRLKTLTGTIGIKSLIKRAAPLISRVYNLKIKDSDRYMVGKDGLIVRDY